MRGRRRRPVSTACSPAPTASSTAPPTRRRSRTSSNSCRPAWTRPRARCWSSSRGRSSCRRRTRAPPTRPSSGARRASISCSRTTSRCAARTSPTRRRRPTQGGNPDVQFGFNSAGNNAFQNVTGQIAHRGQDVSTLGQTLDQHFAVALDTQLLTVPSIDYKVYPDGITGGNGADITGGFTQQSASDLATQLRFGALPINLKLISTSQVSATLGKQALHQGLVAGLAGLIVVALFLLLYYRLLGLIAVAGLAAYALYFYALIKLIPITLTLPGIAGLILTIGVAADANIVIFERVKEEIRAGRSIRSGIATGYKKGLTAIIDANVVTIMTAFILFVLATAEVQGFAFTLGIGVIVSLFTAVMATQAILMSMGDTKMISRPSLLGVREKRTDGSSTSWASRATSSRCRA